MRQMKNVTILSLDYPLADCEHLTLGDTIADERVNVCEDVCRKLSRKNYRLLHISQPSTSLKMAA